MSPQRATTRREAGFSLIELMLVVLVIGVIAAIGAPVLLDARVSAQRAAAISNLRRIHGAQSEYRIGNDRYATLQELNTFQGGGLGQTVSSLVVSSNGYTYQMTTPTSPSVGNVYSGFTIQASGFTTTGLSEVYVLTADGSIQQISPVMRDLVKF